MSQRDQKADVLIIGGGPAGSTAGTLLSRRGHRVVLLEKEKFPRDVVGESLLPFCYNTFKEIGVLDDMIGRFVRKPGVKFIDSDGNRYTNWCFNHIISDETHLSFQVKRSEFDQLLLENARKTGVEALEEHRVQEVELDREGGGVAVRAVDAGGESRNFAARFLIDASGRETFMGRRMGWKEPNPELLRTALWSHWEDVELKGGLEEGLSIICYIGQEKKGWLWIFPLSDHRLTIGAVMENDYMRSEKARLSAAGSDDWQQDLYLQEIMASGFVKDLLRSARRVLPVIANGNYSYKIKQQYGENFALVGDARGFIDPIFSSGIFLSMKSSTLLSQAVHEKLVTGNAAASMAHVYAKINGGYEFVRRMIRLFYNPHVINWAQMGDAGAILHKSHENALAAGHYMLAGDFFESHAKYDRFFQALEDEKTFKYYYKVVIGKHEAAAQRSCDSRREEIFRAFLPSEPAPVGS
jgi:hypothetical protein